MGESMLRDDDWFVRRFSLSNGSLIACTSYRVGRTPRLWPASRSRPPRTISATASSSSTCSASRLTDEVSPSPFGLPPNQNMHFPSSRSGRSLGPMPIPGHSGQKNPGQKTEARFTSLQGNIKFVNEAVTRLESKREFNSNTTASALASIQAHLGIPQANALPASHQNTSDAVALPVPLNSALARSPGARAPSHGALGLCHRAGADPCGRCSC